MLQTSRREHGFTLIELLVVILLVTFLFLGLGGLSYNFFKNWSVSRDRDRVYRVSESLVQDLVSQVHWADSVEIAGGQDQINIVIDGDSVSYYVDDNQALIKEENGDPQALTSSYVIVTSFNIQEYSNHLVSDTDYIHSYRVSLELMDSNDSRIVHTAARTISVRESQREGTE